MRVEIAPAHDDEIVAPPRDEQLAPVQEAVVADAVPIVREPLGRQFGVAVVARAERIAADFDLADVAVLPRTGDPDTRGQSAGDEGDACPGRRVNLGNRTAGHHQHFPGDR